MTKNDGHFLGEAAFHAGKEVQGSNSSVVYYHKTEVFKRLHSRVPW
jgi:hypothetical protein